MEYIASVWLFVLVSESLVPLTTNRYPHTQNTSLHSCVILKLQCQTRLHNVLNPLKDALNLYLTATSCSNQKVKESSALERRRGQSLRFWTGLLESGKIPNLRNPMVLNCFSISLEKIKISTPFSIELTGRLTHCFVIWLLFFFNIVWPGSPV